MMPVKNARPGFGSRNPWSRFALTALGLLAACAPVSAPPPTPPPTAAATASGDAVAAGTLDSENISQARQRGRQRLFTWQELSPAAFAQAAAAGKLVLLDCVAVWCHWCHVMDETTYEDPEVGALLRDRFVTLRVDVDARPEIGERYQAWGWPATVLFSPGGEELGKFRGYLSPEELRSGLRAALAAPSAGTAAAESGAPSSALIEPSAAPEHLPWVGAAVMRELDSRFDDEEGGWGNKQKLPIGANIEVELLRGSHGDAAALARARLTLDKQRQLLDPVWGGFYQYSTGGVWTHPHFEKRLPIQTDAILALVRAAAQLHDSRYLDDALRVEGYLHELLQDEDGAFLVSQDADLGGAEGHGRFIDGHVYYALDAAARRARGIPRVDRSVYPYENGLGIAALAALAQAIPQKGTELLGRARRAADLMLARHVDADGTVRRSAARTAPRLLADAASLGWGLARLGRVSGDGRYSQAARRIALAMLRNFAAPSPPGVPDGKGALWAHTPDPGAVGIFARRERPFSHNVLAARLLGALGDPVLKARAIALLAAISTPRALADEGRMVGAYLLALDELGQLRWRPPASSSHP